MSKKEVWGVVRPDKNGKWHLLDDETHQSSGIREVSQTDVFVQIDFKNDFTKIHWAAVTPDEKMIFHGIQVGASVRMNCARVYFSKMGIPLVPELLQIGKKSNFWFYVTGT